MIEFGRSKCLDPQPIFILISLTRLFINPFRQPNPDTMELLQIQKNYASDMHLRFILSTPPSLKPWSQIATLLPSSTSISENSYINFLSLFNTETLL